MTKPFLIVIVVMSKEVDIKMAGQMVSLPIHLNANSNQDFSLNLMYSYVHTIMIFAKEHND